MSEVLVLWLAAALAATPPLALDVTHHQQTLTVRFALLDPLPEPLETGLASGATVRIHYPLRIRSPRRLWWDNKVWKGEATTTVTFDPVTGRYRCELVLDGVIVTSQELDDGAAARRFLIAPGPVLLSLPAIKKTQLEVRVRAVFASATKWLLFPAVDGTDWVEVAVDIFEPPSPETTTPVPVTG
jgi:hypothetical protein